MTTLTPEKEACPGCGDGDSVPATGYFICQVCDAEWNGEDLDLPPPVPTEEGAEPQLIARYRLPSDVASRPDAYLDVPIPDSDAVCATCRWRFAHAPDCADKDRPWPTIMVSRPTQAQDVARTYSQAEVDSILKAAFPRVRAVRAAPITVADDQPQDVAGLVEVLEEAKSGLQAFTGHATQSTQDRIDRILALRPSPISHESKALELAAADNNHKALVEALEPFAAIQPSSLYPADGSEAEGYAAFLEGDRPMFTGADLARARQALASLTSIEVEPHE